MLAKTFSRGGRHIPHHKGATNSKSIVEMPAPKKVIIPLQQHIGAPCDPLVKVGDKVKLGQKIGESLHFITSPVHASVSGEVISIAHEKLLDGCQVLSIVIANDGLDDPIASKHRAISKLSAKQIRKIIKDLGMVGLGGAGFPTHVKISSAKPIDTVVINGAECEPYLTCDHRLMVEKGEELVYGLKTLMKAVGASRGVIGIEVNKLDAIAGLQEIVRSHEALEVVALQIRYPQGAEKQLIKAAVDREVLSGCLPSEVGCLVSNVHTAVSIAQGIRDGISLYQRVVTVSGRHIHDPRNVMVRIGTPIQALLDFCGGINGTPAVVVGGGPMTGPAVVNLEAPVVKNLSGVLLLGEDEIAQDENLPCIRCARCVDACPMGLTPNILGLLSSRDEVVKAEKLHIMDCVECALCSYVCPSRRGLVSWIKQGKKSLVVAKSAEQQGEAN